MLTTEVLVSHITEEEKNKEAAVPAGGMAGMY
jgi:hypothetical protein